MAVSVILIFFLLLIAGMFITGGITTSVATIAVLMMVMGFAGLALVEMYRLLHRDE